VTAHRYAFSPARIEVEQGAIVKLTVSADDIPHRLTIDAFRVSKRVSPGQVVTIEFRADQVGTHSFCCSLTGRW
jgi:heme/copper-type cytochrome/quinol oxidase subunit 2